MALFMLGASAASAQPTPPPSKPIGDMSKAQKAAKDNALRDIDTAIHDLSNNTGRLDDCIQAYDVLRHGVPGDAAAESNTTGKSDSKLGFLVTAKRQRLSRKRQECVVLIKDLDEHFSMAMRALAGFIPPDDPAIPKRRQKILELRENFNTLGKRFSAKGPAKGSEK